MTRVNAKRAPVVVTGASRGIGAAIANELTARGHSVVGLSRSRAGPAGRNIECDITDESAVRDVLGRIGAESGIFALVNNAGLHLAAPSATLASAEYDEVMAVNARAVMTTSRDAYPYLVAACPAKIVNIGSFFDKLGVVENLAYCASKAAVAALTRCLAVEWASDGIAVINVAPGYVETDLNRDYLARDGVRRWLAGRIPLGRPGAPGEVARLVAALVDEDIPFLTGETIYIDGGQGMHH